MKRIFLFFWFVTIVICPNWGHDRASLEVILPLFDAYVEQSRLAEGIPGVVVVVVKDGKIVHLKGFGGKTLGQKEPVDGHTPFALASVTKTFTNTLVARLVDQGKLQWGDLVAKYLPDFHLSDSEISKDLKVEDLLSHRSGLPGYTADSLISLGWSAPEIVNAMHNIPTEGKFRQTYNYQNAMVGLVGIIMEKVTGKPLAQLYQEEIFQPAGLTETWVGERNPPSFWKKILGLFHKGGSQPSLHDQYHGKTRVLPRGNPGLYTFPASSGIISTGEDLGRWLIFQLNKTQVEGKPVVSEENLNPMRVPHVEVVVQGGRQFPPSRVTKVHYGMGWFIHDYAGASALSHMGGMAGTRALLMILPQENVGIAILANFGGMRVSLFPEAIRNKFFDLYLKAPDEQDWAKTLRESIRNAREENEKQRRLAMVHNPAPARNLEDYTGIYENTLYGQVEIRQKGSDLILTYRGGAPVKLAHWNENVFQFDGSDLSFGFSGTDRGEVLFSQDRGKSGQMMINLLDEGADSTFHRVG